MQVGKERINPTREEKIIKKNLNLMKLIQSTVWASYTSRGKKKKFHWNSVTIQGWTGIRNHKRTQKKYDIQNIQMQCTWIKLLSKLQPTRSKIVVILNICKLTAFLEPHMSSTLWPAEKMQTASSKLEIEIDKKIQQFRASNYQ